MYPPADQLKGSNNFSGPNRPFIQIKIFLSDPFYSCAGGFYAAFTKMSMVQAGRECMTVQLRLLRHVSSKLTLKFNMINVFTLSVI